MSIARSICQRSQGFAIGTSKHRVVSKGRVPMVVVIQYLRGLASLLVVYTHLDVQIQKLLPGHHLPFAAVGAWGVDIFFVISGFIMYVAAIDVDVRPGEFLARRAIRIIPLYWLLTALVVVGVILSPAMFSSTRFDMSHILASLAFLPWPNPAYSGYWPVLIPGWTLNYEMFFYAIVAIGLLAPRKYRLALISITLLAVLAAVSLSRAEGPISFYGNDIVIEFLFGLLAGHLFTKRRALGVQRGCLLIGLSLVLVIWMSGRVGLPRSVAYGVPALMIVLGSLQFEALSKSRPFQPAMFLGDISYSLYLTHVIALPATTAVFAKLAARYGLDLSAVYPVVAMLWALLVAALVYRMAERPLTRILRVAIGERRRPGQIKGASGVPDRLRPQSALPEG